MITASWWTFVLAALKALPALISLVSAIKGSADAAANRGLGYDQAVADSHKKTADMVAGAKDATTAAEADHAAHPKDDGGFDPEFQRK